jgi:hypothetical protein
MEIVAIGGMPVDLEIGCLGTLSKFQKQGHQVSLVAVGKKSMWTKKMVNSFKELSTKIGTSQVYFTDRFDYSSVTQDNVNVLRSIIEPIHPSVAIFPFNMGSDRKSKIISESSLLACRSIENVLMYEIHKNKIFLPNVYFVLDDKTSEDTSSFRRIYAKDAKKKSSNNKLRSIHRFYAKIARINRPVEAFVSHRAILLNNSGFGGM